MFHAKLCWDCEARKCFFIRFYYYNTHVAWRQRRAGAWLTLRLYFMNKYSSACMYVLAWGLTFSSLHVRTRLNKESRTLAHFEIVSSICDRRLHFCDSQNRSRQLDSRRKMFGSHHVWQGLLGAVQWFSRDKLPRLSLISYVTWITFLCQYSTDTYHVENGSRETENTPTHVIGSQRQTYCAQLTFKNKS